MREGGPPSLSHSLASAIVGDWGFGRTFRSPPSPAYFGLLVSLLLLTGCRHWYQSPSVPIPREVSDTGIQERVLLPPGANVNLADTIVHSDKPPLTDEGREVFTLADAVAFGLRNNPRLRGARAAIEQAQGETQVAFAPFLPTVDFLYRAVGFSSEVQVTSQNIPAVIGLGPGTQAFTQGELQLQWTVWDFGRTAARYGRAMSREQIATLRFERAKQTIAFDVAAAYLRVLHGGAARLVQEQAIVRAESVLKDTVARRRGGVADRDDVLRAEVQLSETREALATARQLEFDAVARLNLVMGRNVSCPLRLLDLDTRPGFALGLGECLETAASLRREVEIARAAVVAAEYGLEAAQAEFRPRIYAKGLVTRVDGRGVDTENVQAAGLHFDQRLFDGFRRTGERNAARASVEESLANAQQILDHIALEVNLAFREIASTRERIRLAETSVTQARENLRLVRVKYLNGDATPTDIVDAETVLTRSQQRYYAATYDYLTALARLDYAMGRMPGDFFCAPAEPKPELLPVPRALPEIQ